MPAGFARKLLEHDADAWARPDSARDDTVMQVACLASFSTTVPIREPNPLHCALPQSRCGNCLHSSRARCRCPGLGHEWVDSLNIVHRETERWKVARVLLKHGADAPALAEDGLTPIQWASDRGYAESACFLREHIAKATTPDELGSISLPLLVASQRTHTECRLIIYQDLYSVSLPLRN